MSDAVPMEIQERLKAIEARRLEITSENAADRTAAEYAVARIGERAAEKGRLKIEARALRMAVKAYAARSVLEDLEQQLEDFEMPDVKWVSRVTEVEQPKDGAKEPVLREVETLPEGTVDDFWLYAC